jgi:hypothetical protein
MKIRLATHEDKEPFLAGLIECNHTVNSSGLLTVCSIWSCPLCKGTGSKIVPVVIEDSPE